MRCDFAGDTSLARFPRRTDLSASEVERWATCRRAPVNLQRQVHVTIDDVGLSRCGHARAGPAENWWAQRAWSTFGQCACLRHVE